MVSALRRQTVAIVAADSLAAVYMEGVFQPGMSSVVHRHPAPAWFTLDGSMCVETQRRLEAALVSRVSLCATDFDETDRRRKRPAAFARAHPQDATKPRSTPAHDWTPKGLCTA